MKLRKELMEAIENAEWAMTEDESYYTFEIFSPAGQDFIFDIDKNEAVNLETLSSAIYDYYNCFDVDEATYLWLDETGHGRNGAPYNMEDVLEDMKWCENKIYELFIIVQKEEIRQRDLYWQYVEDWCNQRGYAAKDVDDEYGINGECYVCFEEFCDNEYFDDEYMTELENRLTEIKNNIK